MLSMILAEGTTRGSAVNMPGTSVLFSMWEAPSMLATSDAVKSLPPRPSVVTSPWLSLPTKPSITTTSHSLKASIAVRR